MPPNSTTAMTPIIASVVAALRALGRSKDGTPLLIASTPVSAVQPEANARTTSNSNARLVKFPTSGSGSAAVDASGSPPVTAWTPAHTNISRVSPTKA